MGVLDYFRFLSKFAPFHCPEESEGLSSQMQGKLLCTAKSEITNLERIVTKLSVANLTACSSSTLVTSSRRVQSYGFLPRGRLSTFGSPPGNRWGGDGISDCRSNLAYSSTAAMPVIASIASAAPAASWAACSVWACAVCFWLASSLIAGSISDSRNISLASL